MATKTSVRTTTPVRGALKMPESGGNISGAADGGLPIKRTQAKWRLIGSLKQ